ncbi:MAG: hypothetical protein WAJ87_16830 [Bryobacteraceae bacterium]
MTVSGETPATAAVSFTSSPAKSSGNEENAIWSLSHQAGESLRLYGPENPVDLPRGLESLAEVAIQCGQPEHALTLAGAAAAIRKRFHVRTMNPAQRAEVEKGIDSARKNAGAQAAAFWMKGWNMSLEEIVGYAVQNGDDT